MTQTNNHIVVIMSSFKPELRKHNKWLSLCLTPKQLGLVGFKSDRNSSNGCAHSWFSKSSTERSFWVTMAEDYATRVRVFFFPPLWWRREFSHRTRDIKNAKLKFSYIICLNTFKNKIFLKSIPKQKDIWRSAGIDPIQVIWITIEPGTRPPWVGLFKKHFDWPRHLTVFCFLYPIEDPESGHWYIDD